MKTGSRLLPVLLALAVVLGMLPFSMASAAGDAMAEDEVRALLNSVELHPQRTGYPAVDALIQEILAPCVGADTYTKVKTAYEWVVYNVYYSWDPYSQDYAPAYDCFAIDHELEAQPGLEPSAPYEIINRAYHAMEYEEGVCYDYAAAFTLLVRFIGIDAFVHTGTFLLETAEQTPCHHGWTELLIDGEYYIFDPQREYRMTYGGREEMAPYYFCIASEDAWRYPEPETELNVVRDAQFLPVAAPRARSYTVSVEASLSGRAEGGGLRFAGQKTTVRAFSDSGAAFLGWFDEGGQILSQQEKYTFSVTRNVCLTAVFQNELGMDGQKNYWYYLDTNACWVEAGRRPFLLGEAEPTERSMALALVETAARRAGSEAEPLPEWIFQGAALALEGEDASYISREEYLTLLVCLAEYMGKAPAAGARSCADGIGLYAADVEAQARAMGLLVEGESTQGLLTRGDSLTLVARFREWIA